MSLSNKLTLDKLDVKGKRVVMRSLVILCLLALLFLVRFLPSTSLVFFWDFRSNSSGGKRKTESRHHRTSRL